MIALRFLPGFLMAVLLPAADFTFGTMLRAGLASNGDWEMTTGSSPGDTSQPQAQVFPNGFSTGYYSDGGWHYFEAGYDGVRGYIRFYDSPAPGPGANSILTSYAAAAPPAANATWTLNAYLRATPNNSPVKPYSGIALGSLALGTGLTVIQPLSATAFSANQTGNDPAMQTNMAPVSFQSSNAGGAWMISGQVRFEGLTAYTPNGASRSQLQFGLTATATEVPEPATWLTFGGALAITCIRYSWQRRRRGPAEG